MTEAKRIGIFGQTGEGKSTIVDQLLEQRRRVLILDPSNDSQYRSVAFEDYGAMLDHWEKVHRGSFRIMYRPADPMEHFDRICNAVYALGNMTLVIEEADLLMPNPWPPTTLPSFRNVVFRGRKYGIELIYITQRPQAVPSGVRSQTKEIFVFNQIEKLDIDFFKPVLGQHVEEITKLQRFEYIHWERDGHRITKSKTVRPS